MHCWTISSLPLIMLRSSERRDRAERGCSHRCRCTLASARGSRRSPVGTPSREPHGLIGMRTDRFQPVIVRWRHTSHEVSIRRIYYRCQCGCRSRDHAGHSRTGSPRRTASRGLAEDPAEPDGDAGHSTGTYIISIRRQGSLTRRDVAILSHGDDESSESLPAVRPAGDWRTCRHAQGRSYRARQPLRSVGLLLAATASISLACNVPTSTTGPCCRRDRRRPGMVLGAVVTWRLASARPPTSRADVVLLVLGDGGALVGDRDRSIGPLRELRPDDRQRGLARSATASGDQRGVLRRRHRRRDDVGRTRGLRVGRCRAPNRSVRTCATFDPGTVRLLSICRQLHVDRARILARYQDVVSELQRDAAARMDQLLGNAEDGGEHEEVPVGREQHSF